MAENENLENKPASDEIEKQKSEEELSKAGEKKVEESASEKAMADKSASAEVSADESTPDEVQENEPADLTSKGEEKEEVSKKVTADAERQTGKKAAESIEESKPEIEKEAKKREKKEEKGKEAPSASRWYVIQALSGKEEKVKEAIEKNIQRLNMDKKIFEVLIPEEEVVEIKGAKRIERKKKMFPGYVFLNMILDDESWYAIRQTPGVARFIGTKIKPTPVSDREMQRVLKQLGVKEEKLEVEFKKGQTVRVISGPFRGYTGTVDEINQDKEKLKVLINIFGRDTPVEVNFEHAEKIV